MNIDMAMSLNTTFDNPLLPRDVCSMVRAYLVEHFIISNSKLKVYRIVDKNA